MYCENSLPIINVNLKESYCPINYACILIDGVWKVDKKYKSITLRPYKIGFVCYFFSSLDHYLIPVFVCGDVWWYWSRIYHALVWPLDGSHGEEIGRCQGRQWSKFCKISYSGECVRLSMIWYCFTSTLVMEVNMLLVVDGTILTLCKHNQKCVSLRYFNRNITFNCF